MTRVLLLPSPLLPADTAAPLADTLGRRGWGVVVAPVPEAPPDAQTVLGTFRQAVHAERPDLVVTHSNGGRYAAPAAPGIPVVHVDAALPPEHGDATLAPEGMLERLADMANDDGLLPPWSRWWPEDDFAKVLPDPAARADLRVHETRMPLSYFGSRLGAPPGWVGQPQAYLAFGDTYAAETAFAREHGWPTTVLSGALHLHHLVAPDAVAAEVLTLAARIGVPAGR